MKYIFILFVVFCKVGFVLGGDGCYSTIFNLVNNSDEIILGTIISFEKGKDSNKNTRVYNLKIIGQNVNKRSLVSDTVVIDNFSSYSLNSIDRFTDCDEKLMIFIYKRKLNGRLETWTYDCSILKINREDEAVFISKVHELLNLKLIEKDKVRINKTIDWAISCMKNKCTNWHGVEVLSRRGPLYYYDSAHNEYKRNKKYRLNRSQKQQIKEYLLTKTFFSYNDVFLVELVSRKKEKKLLDKLIAQLKLSNFEKIIWYRELNIMNQIVRMKDDELDKIIGSIYEIGIYSRNKKLNQLTKDFINLL